MLIAQEDICIYLSALSVTVPN